MVFQAYRSLLLILLFSISAYSQTNLWPSSVQWWHLSQGAKDSLAVQTSAPDSATLKNQTYTAKGPIVNLQGYTAGNSFGQGVFAFIDSAYVKDGNNIFNVNSNFQYVRLTQQIIPDTLVLKKNPGIVTKIFVEQLSSANIKGAGWFVYVDSTDLKSQLGSALPDKVTVFDALATNRVWVREEILKGEPISISMAGAYGDGINDDTVPFQNASDAASAKGLAPILLSAGSTYRLTATVNLHQGVSLVAKGIGDYNADTNRRVFINWEGSHLDTIFVFDAIPNPSNSGYMPFDGLTINGGTYASHAYAAFYMRNRADLGTKFTNFQITNCEYGWVFAKGGINLFFEHFRTDAIFKASIRFFVTSSDNIVLKDYTIDNDFSAVDSTGPVIIFEMDSASTNGNISFTSIDGRIEVNGHMGWDKGVFRMNTDPGNSTISQFLTSFINTGIAYASGKTGWDIYVDPPSDAVAISAVGSGFSRIKGVPQLSRSWIGTRRKFLESTTQQNVENVSFMFVSPFGPSSNITPTIDQRMAQFQSEVSFNQPLWFNGKRAHPVIAGLPDTTTFTIFPTYIPIGSWFYDSSDRTLRVTLTDGTAGKDPGVTGTASSGTNLLTVSEPDSFKILDSITIGGENKYISAIREVDTLRVHSNFSGSHTGAAIIYRQPTFDIHYMRPLIFIKDIELFPSTGDSIRWIINNTTDATKDTSEWIGLH